VHLISRYFTWIVFAIAAITAVYWSFNNPSKIWNSVTAVMIIACPCALLLSNTFTNGNILRLLSRKKFYLRNAQAIEDIADANHIVFDKTGTLTTGSYHDIEYEGEPLSSLKKKKIAMLASQSSHPLSKAVSLYLGRKADAKIAGSKKSRERELKVLLAAIL
jgi:Cu+-exporting ATPase